MLATRPPIETCPFRTSKPRVALTSSSSSVMAAAQKTRYIGESITLATEFHDDDFIFDDHAKACEPIISERQRISLSDAASTRAASLEAAQDKDKDKDEPWENFFSTDAASNKFYKQRRYLLLEFPLLKDIADGHVIEIGAGGGGSLLPVLAFNSKARATATDISKTSLSQLKRAAELTLEGSREIGCFVCDSSDPILVDRFQGLEADVCLIMYTLSAVSPPCHTAPSAPTSSSDQDDKAGSVSCRSSQRGQEAMMAQAFHSLKPGGRLLIRDHGLYDLVQMRIPPTQFIGPGHTYIRGDRTQAHFFTVEELRSLGESVGFKAEGVRYITVINRNKKTGAEMKRVFVHAQFIKPIRK